MGLVVLVYVVCVAFKPEAFKLTTDKVHPVYW